jgi:hypothetical protein
MSLTPATTSSFTPVNLEKLLKARNFEIFALIRQLNDKDDETSALRCQLKAKDEQISALRCQLAAYETDSCNIISGHTELPTESFGKNTNCDDDNSDDGFSLEEGKKVMITVQRGLLIDNIFMRREDLGKADIEKSDFSKLVFIGKLKCPKDGIPPVATYHLARESNRLASASVKKLSDFINPKHLSYKFRNHPHCQKVLLFLDTPKGEVIINIADIHELDGRLTIVEYPTSSFRNNRNCGDNIVTAVISNEEKDEPDCKDIREKAKLFLSKILEEKSEEISKLSKEFHSNEKKCVPLSCLELVGLEAFVKSENPTTIPTQWYSDKYYVFEGNPAHTWTISKIMFYETGNKWGGHFLNDSNKKLRNGPIEVLRSALAPEDHFRVYAFIELLNFIQR